MLNIAKDIKAHPRVTIAAVLSECPLCVSIADAIENITANTPKVQPSTVNIRTP